MYTSKDTKISAGSATYEDAITLTGYGKFNYVIIIIGGFALMTSVLATVDVAYVLPASECELKLEKQDRGLLAGAYFIGIVVSLHIIGFLSDRLGRRYILIRSLFTNIFICAVSSFSPNFLFLLVMRFLTGIILCGVLTCSSVYIGEFHSNKNRAKAVTINVSLSLMAIMYSSGLGWLILPHDWSISLFGLFTYTPWRLYYLLLGGIPSTIIGVLMYCLPESPKYLLGCGKKEEAVEILKEIYSFNTGKPKEEYPVKHLLQNPNEQVHTLPGSPKSAGAVMCFLWNQTYDLFMPPHLRNMLLSCLILFAMFYSFSGLFLWIPDIMNQLLMLKDDVTHAPQTFCQIVQSNWTANIERWDHLDPSVYKTALTDKTTCKSTLKSSMFILNTMIGFVLMICALITAFIINMVNRKAFVSTLCFTMIATYTVLFQLSNIYVMILCLATSVILLQIIFCATTALLADNFSTNYRAMAACIAIMSGRIGAAAGGHVFSLFILDECTNVFYVGGALLLLAGISCISLKKPRTNRIIAQPSLVLK